MFYLWSPGGVKRRWQTRVGDRPPGAGWRQPAGRWRSGGGREPARRWRSGGSRRSGGRRREGAGGGGGELTCARGGVRTGGRGGARTGGAAIALSRQPRPVRRDFSLPPIADAQNLQPRIGAKLSREIESEDGGAPICAKSPLPGRSNAAN